MPVLLKVELDAPKIGKRALATIQREANRAVMLYHATTNLPKHFEENTLTRPGGPYGYKPRTRKYLARKQRQVGHARPNVLTGKMRDQVLLNPATKITATQHRSRFIAPGAVHFPLSTDRRQQFLDELQVVTEFERGNLSRLHAARVRAGIEGHLKTDRRRNRTRG